MNSTIQLLTIQKIGTELALAWSDGTESYLDLERVRRFCPCATCGGEPDVLGNLERPKVTYSDQSFNLTSWETVGGYGIQPRWADGHNTGIFTFPYLRKLGAIAE